MNWIEISKKLEVLKHSDEDVNRALFALGWGWSYPLVGAAYCQFDNDTRYHKTDFTGDTDSAFALADRVFDNPAFSITLRSDRSADVSVTCEPGDDASELVGASGSGPSLAIAVVRAVVALRLAQATDGAALIG